MLNLNHKKLEVWENALEFSTQIYKATSNFPKDELFGLTNQLRRASVSVISNLAEGSSRSSSAERKRFYEIARSSLVEIDAQMEITSKLNYLNNDELKIIDKSINELFAKLSNLIKKTK